MTEPVSFPFDDSSGASGQVRQLVEDLRLQVASLTLQLKETKHKLAEKTQLLASIESQASTEVSLGFSGSEAQRQAATGDAYVKILQAQLIQERESFQAKLSSSLKELRSHLQQQHKEDLNRLILEQDAATRRLRREHCDCIERVRNEHRQELHDLDASWRRKLEIVEERIGVMTDAPEQLDALLQFQTQLLSSATTADDKHLSATDSQNPM